MNKTEKNRPKILNSTILVTGGAGFIGSHLVDRLLKEKAKHVIVVDNMFLGNEENLKSAIEQGITFYKDDIELSSSLEYVFNKHDIDIVFNCATKALNYSFINPKNAFSTNVNGTLNLLELQRLNKFNTLVHFSTSEVYGSAVYEPMDEKHPIHPTTSYAAGKAAADLAVNSYVSMYNLDAFIVRPFNNFGPRQNHKGPLAGVIPVTIKKINNKQSPEIHGSGNQSRDFIYVHDTIDAIINLYTKLKPGESINISTDGQISIKDLIQQVCTLMNYDKDIIQKDARDADVLCHNASNEKIKGLIDFNLTPFSEGLEKTVSWYREYFNDQTN